MTGADRTGRWLRFAENQKGAAAVEFSIICVVLVGLLIGIVDFGRTLYVKNQISFLADQATRAILIDSGVSNAEIETRVRAGFDAGNADDLVIAISTDVVAGDSYRIIDIAYPVTLFIPNISPEAFSITVKRRVPNG